MEGFVTLEVYTNESLIETKKISLNEWYEDLHELIDSDEYRKNNAITKIIGTQYDDDEGRIIYQKFINIYDENGKFISCDDVETN
ncbi:MAG: hypothetical protein LBC86_05085 [Oscillospiraceae bacterium]|jgi:hypothetical protein|nr:hypothetical protein [Oscillospiraceae bacterium]